MKTPKQGINKGGRPRDPRITELEQKLNVTRRRAAQILKEEGTSDELRAFRVKKLRLECERIEFELEKARTALEWLPVAELEKFVKSFVSWTQTALMLQSEHLVNELAGKTEIEVCQILRSGLLQSIFKGALAYIGGSGNDARLTETARQYIRELFSLTPDELAGYVAEYGQNFAANAATVPMLSMAVVDKRARDASVAISRHLDEFVSRTACRLPGGSVPENVNLLLDHMRPALAEIGREIDLFRVEVGSAAQLTADAVDSKCARFWRDWERVCALRAAGLERRAAEGK